MNRIKIFLIFFGLVGSLFSQNTATIKGRVVAFSGEPIVGALVLVKPILRGGYTDANGIFSVDKLPAGKYVLQITYIGFDTIRKEISLKPNQKLSLSFKMKEKTVQVQEVEIVGTKETEINKKEVMTGVTKITPKKISILPSLGSPDLAQFIQVLPGVVFTGDQGGQLYVRGGTPIMNKVLLDGAIIYSPFHSIGLFSVFDPDFIRSADIYSAGFSAEFGGRMSSIMDIKTRKPNFNRFKGKVFTNTLTGGFLLEGPLAKDKASMLVSFREAHIDQVTGALYNKMYDDLSLPYNFIDFFGKVSLGTGVTTADIFAFYQNDKVLLGNPADIVWNAKGAGGNFMLLPANSPVIMSGAFAYSDFKSQVLNLDDFPRTSSIKGFNGNFNFSYIFNTVDRLIYGLEFLGFNTNYVFTNSIGFKAEQIQNNTEAAAFFKYKKVIRKETNTDGKPGYKDLAVIEPSLRIHYYNTFNYVSLEPRLRAKLNFKNISFSGAIGRYSQNLMAATSDKEVVNLFQGFVIAPEDLNDKVLNHNLQIALHYLGGVEVTPIKNFKTNFEVWYKDFVQVTAINRERLFPSDPVFITEQGYAYGADFSLTYQTPKIYLYAVYGWMKTERITANYRYYPVWDRRHNVNFIASYKIGKVINQNFKESQWAFSLRWNFGSGFPFTQTQGFYEEINFYRNGSQSDLITQNGNLNLLLSQNYNGARLPNYHRMDISIKRFFSIADWGLLEINFNAINVYNRPNIFYFDRIQQKRVDQLPFLPTAGIRFSW